MNTTTQISITPDQAVGCPECNETMNLTYEAYEHENDVISQTVSCDECETTWIDTYVQKYRTVINADTGTCIAEYKIEA